MDDRNPEVAKVINIVKNSNSANDQAKIEEWELELKTCKHTENLVQENIQKITDKGKAHCNKCDLTTNLWLCMICGNLSCGRKNYDGSGGNNHAVDHFKETGHCLSVKMGTITPEGKASIHCYSCDEEVLDLKLQEHLS